MWSNTPMRRVFALLGMILLAAPSAQASLIGTQVTGSMIGFGGNLFGSGLQTRTVAVPGIEFSRSTTSTIVEADFDANSLTIRLIVAPGGGGSAFSALPSTFEFLTPGLVTGVSVAPGGTVDFNVLPTLSSDTLTFTTAPTDIVRGGTTVSVTLLLTTRDDSAAVPTPAALALFGVALLGLGAVARRRA
jgi:hypothetical protein